VFGFLAEGGGTPPPAHNNFGDTMSDGIAGPVALLIILLLAVATVLLIRSMNKHLRRLPESFPAEAPRARRGAGGTAAGHGDAERGGADGGAPDVGSAGAAAAGTVAPTSPSTPAGS
jgi:hypothetical protein